MGDHNFGVGQQFEDVKSFRKAIKEAAIAQHFELKIIKSDLVRYFAKCAKDGCPWRIRAVKLPNSSTFKIRSIEGSHTCGKNTQLGHHQASVDWIVNLIEERLRDNVNYKPKDILQDIQKQYGITIPYKQAWRAKERGLAAIFGSSEEGYCLLPSYCEQIKKSNPGSIAQVLAAGSENRFQRLFISFSASIHGFLHGCLPLIGLGGIQLKSKYLGTLLSVTSFDADGGLFPVAFSIVDVESDESWLWFLSEFHKLLEMNTDIIPRLTILSDGRKGIVDAVKRRFPTASHGICMRHLTEGINKGFKNSRLVNLLWKAAYSTTATTFKERMAEMEEVCIDAAKWIRQVSPFRWAVVHFQGSRFGHLSSNVDDFHKWILDAHELPIIQIIDRIHSKLMQMFAERRETSKNWTCALVPSAEKHLSEAMQVAGGYHVLRSDAVEFEVISADCSHIVNIGAHACSCRDWQLYGIPCSHAVAALVSCKKDVYEYAERHFSVARFRVAYSREINSIPNKSEWMKTTDEQTSLEARSVRPPKVRRPPGRPEKKRLCWEESNREKHTVHCSRCNQTGHYKRTCKAEIVSAIEY
ncbi:ubiquitin-conjugating enzyme E2 S [Apostasia shenzhenica]|uniref:Ubiquitin-conjugating enzyme E2 S n=1 Tax=Apostasia shenzhenica TaxID=1088818 RepID=A0A2I0AJU8_9ASPA|nr:ubiquitin-conjugating enzyme E2 S [Apostasia shenzhenica]